MHTVIKQNYNKILCPGKHTTTKGRGDKVQSGVPLEGPQAIECAAAVVTGTSIIFIVRYIYILCMIYIYILYYKKSVILMTV